MNLDLLKKLVKLANNNPNDNEANLAARKVCRIIEEGKFNFTTDAAKKEPIKESSIKPGNDFWDEMIRMQREQATRRPKESSYPYGDWKKKPNL